MLKFCPIVQMKCRQVFWIIVLWQSFEYSLVLSWQCVIFLHTVRTVPKNIRMIFIKLWSRKLVCTSSVLSDKISALSAIISVWVSEWLLLAPIQQFFTLLLDIETVLTACNLHPSEATCLSTDCCSTDLALYKSNSACLSRTKRTSSSSH
jgi:hypothetical protein